MTTPGSFPAGTLIPPRRQWTLGEKVVNALVVLCALALLAAVAWLLRFLVTPVVLAFLLTYIMGPLVDLLENRGLARSKAVVLCFAVLLGALATVVAGVWPALEQWMKEAPRPGEQSAFEVQLGHRLDGWEASLAEVYKQVDWKGAFEHLRELLQAQRRTLMEGLPALGLMVLGNAGSVVLALVIAVFLLLDGAAMKHAVVAMVPNQHFENALVMLDRVDRQIASYLRGTAAESALVVVLLVIPLFLLGMPNAFLFAVIFGAANVIPFAGPVIGAAAGLLFSLLDPGAPSAGALLVVYVVIHLVDAMFINPWVMGKSLDMHPLTVIVGISVGGSLGGVLGMLAIIPLIAVAKAVVATVAEGLRNAATG